MINAKTRKVLFKSPIKNICGRRYDIFSDGIVVITHMGDHKEGHRLTLVDREKLTVKITGTNEVFWRSFVEIKEGFIYAIAVVNGDFYLAKFNSELKLVSRSNVRISKNTFISFYGNFIYINRYDKQIMALNKKDLSLLELIKP
ncbi:hypothetical protein ACFL20_09525 [Spirochaetota bacterium]